MTELLLKQEVYAVTGAAMDVYNELGPGFLEAVYQEAMEIELKLRGIPFESQKDLIVHYKGRRLNKTYTPDFLMYDKLVVEIKALDRLTPIGESIMLNYLKATRLEVGLLINFGAANDLEWKRMVRSANYTKKPSMNLRASTQMK
jgi:GxxExxY protein